MKLKEISEHARALSALGASKGGIARKEKLSEEQRREIAAAAARARWGSDLPKATHGDPDHPLMIGDIEIPCYVLDNGMRVITHRGLQGSLAMGIRGGARDTVQFIEVFASNGIDCKDLIARVSNPIEFRPPIGGRSAFGYEATVLADFCDMVLDARKKLKLSKRGKAIAERCETLVRGFARVGIISLVDEATGYQEYRNKNELKRILEAYVATEYLPWTRRFPPEFYEEMFRLRKWKNPESIKKPILVGFLTESIVYKRLPEGVVEELKRKNPKDEKGRRKRKHHQFLTNDVGNPHLERHLAVVIAFMRVSKTWEQFRRLLDKAIPPHGDKQPLLDGMSDVDGDDTDVDE